MDKPVACDAMPVLGIILSSEESTRNAQRSKQLYSVKRWQRPIFFH